MIGRDARAADLDPDHAPAIGQQPGDLGPRPHLPALADDRRRERPAHHLGHAAEERADAQGEQAGQIGAEGAEEGVGRVPFGGQEVEAGGQRDQRVADGVLRHPGGLRLLAHADPVEGGRVAEVLEQAGGQESGEGETVEQREQLEVAEDPAESLERIVERRRAEDAAAAPVGQADLDLVLPVDDVVEADAGLAQESGEGRVEPEDAVEPGLHHHPPLVPGRGPAADDRGGLQHQHPAPPGAQLQPAAQPRETRAHDDDLGSVHGRFLPPRRPRLPASVGPRRAQ